ERAGRHTEARRSPGKRHARGKHPHGFRDADRGDREIGAAKPKRRQPDEKRKKSAGGRRERQRHIGLDAGEREQRRHVGPDPDERRIADRDLAGKSSQQIPGRGEHDGKREIPDVVQTAPVENELRGKKSGERENRSPQQPKQEMRTGQENLRRLIASLPKAPSSP